MMRKWIAVGFGALAVGVLCFKALGYAHHRRARHDDDARLDTWEAEGGALP
jgi:hypothetical protein